MLIPGMSVLTGVICISILYKVNIMVYSYYPTNSIDEPMHLKYLCIYPHAPLPVILHIIKYVVFKLLCPFFACGRSSSPDP